MSFLGNFFHHPPSHPEYQGPPQPPAPWRAEYDNQSQRWYFVNQQTGQRSWDFPQPQGGYNNNGYPPQQQAQYQQPQYQQAAYQPEPAPQHESHTGRNTAIAAVAGLAGGALLMHEGHEIEQSWDADKERIEDRVDYDEQRVEDFPEDAANWTGRKVQDVEDFPEDAANWAGEKVQDVEDITEDVAGWAGEKVQGVENFGDDIRDSYDDGRQEAANDDSW